ncbi:MAG: DNA translocase FtsK 4TM domain-containing protein [Armatimonadota bacterium]
MLVALATSNNSGDIGSYISAALTVSLGIGAWVVPFLSAVLGIIVIVGPLKIIPRNIGLGGTMLFLVVVSWASLSQKIDPENHFVGGGYLGDFISRFLQKWVGEFIGYIVLISLAVVSVIVIVDAPLSGLFQKLHSMWSSIASLIKTRYFKKSPSLKDTAVSKAEKIKKPVIEKDYEVDDDSDKKSKFLKFFGKPAEEDDKQKQEIEFEEELPKSRMPVRVNGLPEVSKIKPEITSNSETGNAEFQLPPPSLLDPPQPQPKRVESELKENIEIIERTLAEFRVEGTVVEIAHGPTVTRYEIRLAPGIKVNKIVSLADNLAMQLAAIDVRVEAPIPGKAAIGVEVPNRNRGMVSLRELVESKTFNDSESKLTFVLGKDVSGRSRVADLAKMPHLLIGGATNAGKSVCLNTLISSLLFRATPDELKLVLIDPKRVELALFDEIPHLACPVVKDSKLAAGTLRSVVQEMERRYDLFVQNGARNIISYNERVEPSEKLPYMVVVVDELCDLMIQAAAEVESSIMRIAQFARAAGVHLVIATQRPSVDVITGVIKANISSRIAFAVSSHHDSRTILDQKGAERLVGRGDMLFLPIDASKPVRIQGCYVSEREVEALADFLKAQRKPNYIIKTTVPSNEDGSDASFAESTDKFYEDSVRFIVNTGYCSTSMIQRKFKIGYNRAARIVDTMEEQGIVGPLDGAKPRQVLISKSDLDAIFRHSGPRLPDDYDKPDQDFVVSEAPDDSE